MFFSGNFKSRPVSAFRFEALVFVASAVCAALFTTPPAGADTLAVRWLNPFGACSGNCAVHASVGQLIDENMTHSFGLNHDFMPDAGDFVAPWDYDYRDSYLLSATASRRVLDVGGWASAELEAGVGQRLGDMQATEFWGALYLRWQAFPWNAYVRTSLAISTGLSYATKVDEWERMRDDARRGNKLLHYLSPEITLAHPGQEHWELVLRYHHRSGGGNIFGDTALFKGVTGAANHATVGIRYRF